MASTRDRDVDGNHRSVRTTTRGRPPVPTCIRRAASIALISLLVLVGAACGDDDESVGAPAATTSTEVPDTPGAMPEWLERVYPADGADAAERAVEVDYNLLGPREELRVVIDGTDITAQMDGLDRANDSRTVFPSPGQLRYDPRAIATPLVELQPGEHDAAVRLVRLDSFGENLEELDEYAWTFTLQ
jgi:hypothetical protein